MKLEHRRWPAEEAAKDPPERRRPGLAFGVVPQDEGPEEAVGHHDGAEPTKDSVHVVPPAAGARHAAGAGPHGSSCNFPAAGFAPRASPPYPSRAGPQKGSFLIVYAI